MCTTVRIGILCVRVLIAARFGIAQKIARFEEVVKQNRSAIELLDGKLAGPGAGVPPRLHDLCPVRSLACDYFGHLEFFKQ